MFTRWKRNAAILSAAAVMSIGATSALAEEHEHGAHNHDAHAQHGAEGPQLALNNGKKWETDANLRQAMNSIRDALSAELHSIHTGKATTQQYQALAKKVNDQTAFIVKNCKLDQKADAMFHLVLADLVAGADAMAGNDALKARDGAEKVAGALDNYGKYFAHPGWRGVSAGH